MSKAKKSTKKSSNRAPKSPVFTWNSKRKLAAILLSGGTYTYEETAAKVGVNERTLYEWRQSDTFLNEVDRLTLENEKATKAGLIRIALKAIDGKIDKIAEDKTTVLDWAEFISDIQGMKTQKHELDIDFKTELEGARELLGSTIAGISARIRAKEVLEQAEQQADNGSEV